MFCNNKFRINYSDQDWDFMPFRVWVGFWTGLLIFLIVIFDLSALVRYITRFTEESFAALIAIIFIYEAIKKTIEIEHESPVHFHPPDVPDPCLCLVNTSAITTATTTVSTTTVDALSTTLSNETETTTAKALSDFAQACFKEGGNLKGDCEEYVPDVFFFSVILCIATFILATALVNFRHGLFFPSMVSIA